MKRNGSMLDPTINELKAQMNNRYLLVNVAAQRAREIAQRAEDEEISLENKPVTIALHEIADGEVQVVPQEAKAEPEENAAVWDVPMRRSFLIHLPGDMKGILLVSKLYSSILLLSERKRMRNGKLLLLCMR